MLPGIAAAILSAAFYTLAFPPYELSTLAWVALVPRLLVLPHQTVKARLLSGRVCGFSFALGVTSWSLQSVSTYFDIPRLAAALVVSSMYLVYVAGYVALFSVAAGACLRSSSTIVKLTAIPSLWVLYEYARTYLLAGLPWEFIGHSQYRHLPLIQIADLTGELGVSFVVVMVNVAIAEILREAARAGPFPRSSSLRIPLLASAAAATVGLPILYGTIRLKQLEAGPGTIKLALVQANVNRSHSPSRVESARAILDYIRTTRESLDGQLPDLIIWPEYALDVYPNGSPVRLQALANVASRARAGLIFGAPRAEYDQSSKVQLHNTAYFMGRNGRIDGFYDKRRLLPFAEYTPAMARYLLPTREQDIFTAGRIAGVIETGGAGNIGLLICYEALFPRLARGAVRHGANCLVNVSNDGWLTLG